MSGTTLRLQAAEFSDEAHWLWRLTDDHGVLVAEHAVTLDSQESEYAGFMSLYQFVRWHADPEHGVEGEQTLVERVGRWIGERVWGAVGEAIVKSARRAPVVVRVSLPDEAESLLYRPFELGIVAGRSLALQDVSLVFQLASEDAYEKAPIGERLRILALFSVPTDQATLDARSERRELRRLVHRVVHTSGRAIELRVLQYGVTREVLSEVLTERDGWDVIHFSGHGLPAGLVLERSDGTADLVSSDELGALLLPVRERLKLVTLSSCESAATTAAQTMRLLGLPAPTGNDSVESDDAGRALPAVARELTGRLGCAALAMRYPVDDEFAIALARNLYDGLFRDGQPLPRAVQLAIARATSPDHTSVPPLSAATPALFGSSAADLLLAPPPVAPGESTSFDLSSAGLAHFPPEPRRFVGRVGALARASAALVPTSDRRAVLIHGMAGAGKTACALELAYRHQEHRFEAMAWYSAPPEDHDIAGALASFAVALETQLQGLELAHAVDDRELLDRLLPRFARALGERAVLIVLDNVESLLTAGGAWRDERWARVTEALITHDGLSRLVLTSRRVPQGLAGDERVLLEQVDTLSARESVLLARQLPNLGAMIRTGGANGAADRRALVRRVLETMQGNPKLIELADRQAVDPEVLRERLDEAAAAWGEGIDPLASFFAAAAPARDPAAEGFLRVLETWATSSAAGLPEDARTAFQLICALEERDRVELVIDGNWADLWRALKRPGEPPSPHTALATVAGSGLIDIRTHEQRRDHSYHVHPAIEQAGRRGTDRELRRAVDHQLASFWHAMFMAFLDTEVSEQAGPLVIHSGLSAAPYLIRLGRRDQAMAVLERMVVSDRSTRTLAAVLPQLEQIANRNEGTPDELASAVVLAQARALEQPAASIPRLRELLHRAELEHNTAMACSITGHVLNALIRVGQWEEALSFADGNEGYTRRAGLGPWTQLAEQGRRLEILLGLGHNELVLAEIEALREHTDTLPLNGNQQESVIPFNVREGMLKTGRTAAVELGRYETALELNHALGASAKQRAASRLEQAQIAVSACGPLVRLGRYEEAEAVLRGCRDVFEAEQYREGLAVVYGTWSDLEDKFGHRQEAVDFGQRALRLFYSLGEPGAIVGAHHNLANCLARDDQDVAHTVAHRLAAALIVHQAEASSDALIKPLHDLARALREGGEKALPESFAALCADIEHRDGVDLAKLLATLTPSSAPAGNDALREILKQAWRSQPKT